VFSFDPSPLLPETPKCSARGRHFEFGFDLQKKGGDAPLRENRSGFRQILFQGKRAGISKMVKTKNNKKNATIDAIVDATGFLIKEKMGIVLGAREVAARSGYSIGTIYNYFGSLGSVVSHLVTKRRTSSMMRIADTIDRHSPDETIDILAAKVTETFFECFANLPPAVMRFAYTLQRELVQQRRQTNSSVPGIGRA
jgi:AcrR family transcriptional regulator